MPREKTSVSREDYLKAIWEIVQEEQDPISARLAEELGVTPPAVTAALKRMTRDGLLRVGRDGRIALSRKGSAIADRLAMRHQLAEKLLTEVIGLDWTRAHDEAERLEHGISPEVEKLLLARFGAEGFCPHGVPLQGGLAKLRRKYGAVPLSDVAAGRTVEILCVYEKDPEFLEFRSCTPPGGTCSHPTPGIRRNHDTGSRKPHHPPWQAGDGPHMGPRIATIEWRSIFWNAKYFALTGEIERDGATSSRHWKMPAAGDLVHAMLTDGVWAQVEVGNEHLRLFSEHNAQGVQASVYNVKAKTWIAPSEAVDDIEEGKERAVQHAKAYLQRAGLELPELQWKKSRTR